MPLEIGVYRTRITPPWGVELAGLVSSFSLDLRRRVGRPGLFIAGYANGAIGYMPDAHDIERRSYAATQSPKFCGHFPFVPQSGERLVDAMVEAVAQAVQTAAD
ncbi:MAG: hypothetical protein AB1505_13115 [Candidatus Latescibacterota bacterium]